MKLYKAKKPTPEQMRIEQSWNGKQMTKKKHKACINNLVFANEALEKWRAKRKEEKEARIRAMTLEAPQIIDVKIGENNP